MNELRRTMSSAEFTAQYVYDMRAVQRQEMERLKAKAKGKGR